MISAIFAADDGIPPPLSVFSPVPTGGAALRQLVDAGKRQLDPRDAVAHLHGVARELLPEGQRASRPACGCGPILMMSRKFLGLGLECRGPAFQGRGSAPHAR